MIPKNLDEAIKYLYNLKIDPDKIDGMSIRNKWKLWSGSNLAIWFYNIEIYHADDMSGIIISSYESYLKNEPLNIDKQVKKYHKHWEREIGKNHLSIMKKEIEKYLLNHKRDIKIDEIIS